MRSEKQLVKLIEDGWLQEGEKLQRYGGGDRERVHFGSTIGGRHQAPYQPTRPPAHSFDVDLGDVLYPSAPVQQGRFHGDEWVHDPTIRGWVQADSPERAAVECADLLVAGGPEAWFISTDRRIAVVVDASVVGKAEPQEDEEQGESSKGFGRFLGKARSAVSAVTELSESLIGGVELVTLWECPPERFTAMAEDLKGRSTAGSGFSINRFADGSVIEVSTKIHLKGFM
ncbi:hypothetical protein SAMN02982929_03391 [Saccharopolyspora kobensis]|uniref:Uncharacterized protein n=1 Tax=Saccharopolyspora kobensis TaxID=146035 RepID=A0A1H6CFD6_9PSEU|nr:hypothetical protein [Saccharopolyspora kobensis]SEG71739.1 hypothetical protein SAMN02982929_03391 [Saccharopolyspora kobensis]SFC38791.1 hypothetical protein SAMN05216506_101633 [Saccharopolyspora kobensis]